MPRVMRLIFWVSYCWSGITGGRPTMINNLGQGIAQMLLDQTQEDGNELQKVFAQDMREGWVPSEGNIQATVGRLVESILAEMPFLKAEERKAIGTQVSEKLVPVYLEKAIVAYNQELGRGVSQLLGAGE